MVEGAVVLSVWLLIVFAAFDLSLAAFRYNALSEAARRLAREAIVRGSDSSPESVPWGPASYTGNAGDESEFAETVLPVLATMHPDDVQINLQWPDATNDPDGRVHVQIVYEHDSVIPLMGSASTIPLRGDCVMRVVH